MHNDNLTFDNVVEFLEIVADKAKKENFIDDKAIFSALCTVTGLKRPVEWTTLADFVEISRLEADQNNRLKQLAIERANAKRGIKPKKKESGYIVLRYEMEKQRYMEGRKRDVVTAIIQTPYSVEYTLKDIEKFTNEDYLKISALFGVNYKIEIKSYTMNKRSGFWEIKILSYDTILSINNATN